MASFKPIDPKRDEFRRYLERAGVIEALTKLFVRLVKERPENPMEYLQNNLGESRLQADHEAHIRTELEESQAEIQRLRSIIMKLDPTALEDDKETATPETSQGAEGITQVETKNTTAAGEVVSETDVVAAASKASAPAQSSEKPVEGDNNAEAVPQLAETSVEVPAKLNDTNNEASPQKEKKSDEVSAQLTDAMVEVGATQSEDHKTDADPKVSDDNNTDAAPKSSDDNKAEAAPISFDGNNAGAIPKLEDKQIK